MSKKGQKEKQAPNDISRNGFLKLLSLGMGTSLMGSPFSGSQPGTINPVSPFGIPEGVRTRWTSSENPAGRESAGGKTNNGAKGHAFDTIGAGQTFTLLQTEGPGIVNRIKLTTNDRSAEMLRSLCIDIYWDGTDKPAVSAPLGDFFGVGLGQTAAFENDFFSNPEGRSFNCFIPMPFQRSARISITNESDKDLSHIFYNVNYQLTDEPFEQALYFHAFWNRNELTEVGKDYQILPRVKGRGQFLGANIGVKANIEYRDLWWGEGEVKMYIDGDREWPTLVGTGTEDYIGTAWGQGEFSGRYQGCTIADKEHKLWAFYRYHIPDPVYFHNDLKVTIQQIGGGPKQRVLELRNNGAAMELISLDAHGEFYELYQQENPNMDDLPAGWLNFYRRDDWSSTAYFYLDAPQSNLPDVLPVGQRTMHLNGTL